MAEHTDTDQKVDHVEKAQGALQWLVGDKGPHILADSDARTDFALQLAQAHAQIAIAEELRGIREALKEAPHLLDQIAVGVQR